MDPGSINGSQRMILDALNRLANEDGYVSIGQAKLAEEAGVGLRTVQRYLPSLEAGGYIDRQHVYTQANGRRVRRAKDEYIVGGNELAGRANDIPATGGNSLESVPATTGGIDRLSINTSLPSLQSRDKITREGSSTTPTVSIPPGKPRTHSEAVAQPSEDLYEQFKQTDAVTGKRGFFGGIPDAQRNLSQQSPEVDPEKVESDRQFLRDLAEQAGTVVEEKRALAKT